MTIDGMDQFDWIKLYKKNPEKFEIPHDDPDKKYPHEVFEKFPPKDSFVVDAISYFPTLNA